MAGGDDIHTCPECHRTADYFDMGWKRDKRVKSFRFVCDACAEKINAKLSNCKPDFGVPDEVRDFDGFGGDTYNPAIDRERLGAQQCRVVEAMLDGKWRTLDEIHRLTGDPHASISARLRDVRKIYNSDAMQHRRLKDGLFVYRIELKQAAS